MSIKGPAQHLGCSKGSVITAPLHPHSNACSGLPVRLPNLGFEPWWILVLCPLPPSSSLSSHLPSPRPLLRPVLRAPDPLSEWAFQGPAPSLAVQRHREEGEGAVVTCTGTGCTRQIGGSVSRLPIPAFLTPGSAVLDSVAGHCQGWRFPGLRNLGWHHLPGALPWGFWVLGAGLAPSFSFVYAGWQKSSGLLAGSDSSLLLNSFAMESLWAGVEGTGAPPEAGLSCPLALSAMFLLSQNSSGGGS